MVVKADGKDVTASIGIGLPVDAGVRKIEVSAPGFITKTIDVTVPAAKAGLVSALTLTAAVRITPTPIRRTTFMDVCIPRCPLDAL